MLKKILCIVDSKLMSWYGNLKLPNFGKEVFPKLNPQDIKLLPIHYNIISTKHSFIDKANEMLSLNLNLQEASQKFERTIERKFNLKELSNKLREWYLLTYSSFIKELSKKNIKLSLSEEAEWEDCFLKESSKALDIKTRIDTTDKEIDQIVYQLYGLTDEEVKLVEDK